MCTGLATWLVDVFQSIDGHIQALVVSLVQVDASIALGAHTVMEDCKMLFSFLLKLRKRHLEIFVITQSQILGSQWVVRSD